jgi:hypothetical protein
MASPDTIDVLNRVLAILERSFPQYLQYARPYIPPGRENVPKALSEIAACQDSLAARVSEMIFESGSLPEKAKFPIEFTDTHDLSIDYLIEEAIGYQKQDIAGLNECVESLNLAPSAQALALEALGMAKGHRKRLEELAMKTKPGAATIVRNGAPAYDND